MLYWYIMKSAEFGLNISQNQENQEKEKNVVLKRFLKRHLALAIFSALLAGGVPQEEIQAQENHPITNVVNPGTEVNFSRVERKEAYEKLRLILEKEDTLNKVAKLKEEFGPLTSTFLSLHQIKQDLALLEKIENKRNNDADLVDLAGAYKKRWAQPNLEQREPVFVRNVDGKIKNFSSEDLDNFLTDIYPPNYTSNNVAGIEFIPETKTQGNDEVLGQATVFGVDKPLEVGEKRGSLKIYLPKEGIDGNLFIDVAEHEIGHNADYNNSPVLTSAERISMFYEVSLRSKSSNRYKSEYLNGITLEKLGLYVDKDKIKDIGLRKQYLSYIIATEYWAEVQKAYFKDKKKFEKEHPADYLLVDKWVKILSK